MSFVRGADQWELASGGSRWPLGDLYRGRPTYAYNLDSVEQRLRAYQSALGGAARVHYAVKANAHPAIIRLVLELGGFFDVVSAGELERVLECGGAGRQVVFSGVGKTRAEIEFALQQGIFQINVESESELRRIIDVAEALGVQAPVALRLNPDVDVMTHPYIRTGFRENKFGLDEGCFESLSRTILSAPRWVRLQGVTLHIGSLIQDVTPFVESVRKALQWSRDLAQMGHALETLDIGGGLGVFYSSADEREDFALLESFGEQVRPLLTNCGLQVLCEPGRFLVARAGVLLTQVQYVKSTPHKNFVIVDTGLHHLLRPALYSAHHRIENARVRVGAAKLFDVVGPICESSDVLGRDRMLVPPREGDVFAIFDVGAYGAAMMSRYNLHPPAREIFFRAGRELA